MQNEQQPAPSQWLIISASIVLVATVGFLLAQLHPTRYLLQFSNVMNIDAVDLFVSYLMCATIAMVIFLNRYTSRLRKRMDGLHKARSEALKLAWHDGLTGLPNRRKFHEDFETLTTTIPAGQRCGVMMLDIDGFKPVNDVYGHSFGDTLLQTVAQRLRETIGPDGIIARLGGDEFAIVTPPVNSKKEITSLARRIATSLQQPTVSDGQEVLIGTGIGISIFPDDGYSPKELLRRADIALYRAKRSGRSNFRFFELEMDASILHRTLMEQRLRLALSNDDLQPHFQPIYNLKTNHIIGFEALARWTDRDFGKVAPEEFIPIAEDCGLISELTAKLLKKSCEVAQRWPSNVFLSFNISALQLQDHAFPLKVLSILNEAGLAPSRLILEITESSLIRNPQSAKTILQQLSDTGVRIALDDFGTGHSSLNYLRDFPISKVKIDRSFTANMETQSKSAAIINAILALSKGLEIEVIAEGIEEESTLEMLASNGCQYGQGFLFAPAQCEDALPDFLQQLQEERLKQA